MKRLDQFIIKSFLGPFILTFFIVVFILVMQFLWLYIDELAGKGLSFWVIMEFLGWGSATILPLAMPLATLLASIMTLGSMGENNELLAMKAAGISLPRILYPLIYISVIISISAFFVSNDLIPIAYNKIYTLQYDIGRTKEEIKIPTGTFYNGIDGYTLRIGGRDNDTDMMYNVMVYNHTASKGNISLAVADSGLIKSTPDKTSLIFTLYHGISYEETNTVNFRDTSISLNKVKFDMQEIIIPLENYAFQKSEDERYGSEIMAKDLARLRKDRDSIGTLNDNVSLDHEKRVVYALGMSNARQLDTAVNKGILNAENARIDTVTLPVRKELDAVNSALNQVQTAITSMEAYNRESQQYTFFLRRIDLESFRKFTLSFACLIFFFIGAPLGAIIRKGGLGTPVIISALFFVLYWVVDISGKKLARDGVISPMLGAFISTIVLLPIGIFLTWKSTKDSSMFNIDTYVSAVKNFFKRLSSIRNKKRMVSGHENSEAVASEANSAEVAAGADCSGVDYAETVSAEADPAEAVVAGADCSGAVSPKIVFMGTPEFAVASLKALIEGGYNIVGVVTVPDKPSGRGLKVNISAVKEYVLSINQDIPINRNIPILQPPLLKDPDFLNQLSALQADIFVVVAFRMLPKAVWSMPPLGTFNLHASLLPKYRGAAPINWAIINGETETGVTTFLLDEKMDTGAILFQERVPILPTDNIGTLHDRLMEVGAHLVPHTVDALASGTAVPQSQTLSEPALLPAPKLNKENTTIDWSKDAVSIHNLIRGLSPYPAAHSTLLQGDRSTDVKIFAAEPVCDSQPTDSQTPDLDGSGKTTGTNCDKTPGTITTDGKKTLTVQCGSGSLNILELQLAGKKRLGIREFLAGWRDTTSQFC